MKFKILSLLLAVLILLSACKSPNGGNEPTEPIANKYLSQEVLPDKTFDAPENMQNYVACKNIIFALTETELLRINTVTDETKVLMPATGISNIACDKNQLAVMFEQKISVYDYDGVLIKEVALPQSFAENEPPEEEKGRPSKGRLVVDSLYINKNDSLFVWKWYEDDGAHHALYYVDLESGEVSDLVGSWEMKKREPLVRSLWLNGDKTMSYIISGAFGILRGEYDLEKKELTARYELKEMAEIFHGETYGVLTEGVPETKASYEDILNGNVTYIHSGRIFRYDLEGNRILLLYIPTSKIYKDEEGDPGGYDIVYADGDSFVLYNDYKNVFWTTSATLENSLAMIRQVGFSPVNDDALYSQVFAATDRNVIIQDYTEYDFTQAISKKLLAGDTDFDMFIVSDPDMLQSVLSHGAYEPLQNSQGIMEGFDKMHQGIKDIVTLNGNVYGFPISTSGSLGYVQTTEFNIPSNWTVNDMFNACDSLKGDGRTLYYHWRNFLPVVNHYVMDMVAQNDLNPKHLEGFFENVLQRYNDGTIFIKDLSDQKAWNPKAVVIGAEEIMQSTSYLSYEYNGSMVPVSVSGLKKAVAIPTRSGQKYAELGSVLFVNPHSDKKEDALKLIEMFTTDYSLYTALGSKEAANNAPLVSNYGKNAESYPTYSQWDETQQLYFEWYSSHYEGSQIYRLNESCEQTISDYFLKMLSGELAPKQAAEKIVTSVQYLMFE